MHVARRFVLDWTDVVKGMWVFCACFVFTMECLMVFPMRSVER